jgi:hypothetical protein
VALLSTRNHFSFLFDPIRNTFLVGVAPFYVSWVSTQFVFYLESLQIFNLLCDTVSTTNKYFDCFISNPSSSFRLLLFQKSALVKSHYSISSRAPGRRHEIRSFEGRLNFRFIWASVKSTNSCVYECQLKLWHDFGDPKILWIWTAAIWQITRIQRIRERRFSLTFKPPWLF